IAQRRIARVDHVQEEIGVLRLLEGRAERGEELLRQIADEADRVGDDDLALPREADAPRARVEGREELVLREHAGIRQRVQQRALAGVRVADDRHDRDAPARAPRTTLEALFAELLQLRLEAVDPLACAALSDLELRLTG